MTWSCSTDLMSCSLIHWNIGIFKQCPLSKGSLAYHESLEKTAKTASHTCSEREECCTEGRKRVEGWASLWSFRLTISPYSIQLEICESFKSISWELIMCLRWLKRKVRISSSILGVCNLLTEIRYMGQESNNRRQNSIIYWSEKGRITVVGSC